MNVFKKALGLVTGDVISSPVLQVPKNRPFKQRTERELLQLESKIGADIFGPVAPGSRREFFCLDDKTWIWHEERTDAKTGKVEQTTTRYELQEKGVLKVAPGSRYSYLQGAELENLMLAAQLYYENVARGIYRRDPKTGKKLV